MIRKVFLMISVLAATICCGKKQDGFVIKGHIEGFEKGFIVAMPNTPGNKMAADTVEVIDGNFEIRGKVESPTFIWMLPTTDNPSFFGGSFNLFVGNEEITVEGNIENFKKRGDAGKISVKGSPSHDEYLRLEKLFSEVEPGDTKRYVDVMLQENNVATNPIMPYYIYTRTRKENVEDRERYMNVLDKSLDSNIYIEFLKENIATEKRVNIGCLAPDFTLKDLSGKEYKLSDFRGKYVLFEFSASWCGWCKKEIPYLQKVWEEGKDKDFVMFTINLDKTRELWEKDASNAEVKWMQLSDLQAMDGGVAKQYNISGIPQIFLIDKEGYIIHKDLRGDVMIEYIKKLLNK